MTQLVTTRPNARTKAATVAFTGYVVAALLLGEVFPFSRFAMYAKGAGRSEGFVPTLLADGTVTDVRALDRFSGIEPDAMGPGRRPCSLGYRVEEDRRWVAAHSSPDGAPPGPVRVEYGYRRIRVVDGRVVRDGLEVVARGSAWRR